MANERGNWVSFQVYEETAFGVLNAPESWFGFNAWDNNLDGLRREALEDQAWRIDRGEWPRIIGAKSKSTFNFKTYFTGLVTGAGNAQMAPDSANYHLLKAALGSAVRDTGNTATGGGSALAPVVTSDAGFTDEGIVGFNFASGSHGCVWRHVAAKPGGNVLTLSYELPAIPAAADVVYATAHYPMLPDPSATSIQFRRAMERADAHYDAYGCKPDTITIDKVTPGDLMVMGVSCKVATFSDAATGTLTATAIPKVPWTDSQFELIPYGTTVYSAAYRRRLKSFGLTFKNGLVADPDCHATDGVGAWLCNGTPCLEITAEFAADDEWRDALTAGSYWTLIMANGRTPGKTAGVFVRKIMLTDEPSDADNGGIHVTSCKFGLAGGHTAPGIVFFQG